MADTADRSLPPGHRALALTSAAAGVSSLTIWLGMAATHLRDNYHVDHVSGAWFALVDYAREGVFYPPLYDDGFFGGTRYGPLGIAVNALASTVTGETLMAGKAVSLMLMLVLVLVLYRLCRTAGVPPPLALGACGAAVASYPTFWAGTSVYGDLLALVLQLGALLVLATRTGARAGAVVGVLTALAITAKLSAGWGGAVALLWLLVRDRAAVVALLISAATTLLSVFGLAHAASDGRMLDNLLGLGGSGFDGWGALLLDMPPKAAGLLAYEARGTAVVLPLALVLLLVGIARRRLSLPEVALLAAGVVTMLVLNDIGTGFNHLIDLAVLAPVVVAAGASRLRSTSPTLSLVLTAVLPVATLVALGSLRHDLREGVVAAVNHETIDRYRPDLLGDQLRGEYFTEDPLVAVQRGDRPTAMDSFMLLRIGSAEPSWERSLIERFERRDFRTVVLMMDPDPGGEWYSQIHLGTRITRAVDRNYVLRDEVVGPTFTYRVLVRRPTV